MATSTPWRIRLIRTDDQAEVDRAYDVCRWTGAAGEDATALLADPRLVGEIYAGPYLALEPSLAFGLVDSSDTLQGYVIGTADTRRFAQREEEAWWPAVRARHPLGCAPEGSLDARLVQLIHHPMLPPAQVLAEFPAHLHIDLLPTAQGGGNGRRLITTMLDTLRASGSPGVHLGVDSTNARAIGFYQHLGFVPIPGTGLLGHRLG